MEWTGIPVDSAAFETLKANWAEIKGRLVAEVNRNYGVYVPVGQRTIDPHSETGAAILATAAEWEIDPHRLADAVDYLWQGEREAAREGIEARKAARKRTGLNSHRITQIENSGRDYTAIQSLDLIARELANAYPALGLGKGYDPEAVDESLSGRLWDVLRDRDERLPRKNNPDLLHRAAELVASSPASAADAFVPMRFSVNRWADYLIRTGIPWPRLESGDLDLSEDAFGEMARTYPAEVAPIKELRHALSQLRLNALAVGSDNRNRCLLSAFSSKTSRNQPSNTRFIFGPSTWLRGLIRPEVGRAAAYCDWSAQELGIAAALSGDQAMQAAYASGDPYLWLAKEVGVVPRDATKKTHGLVREQFKVVSLGVLYGLSAEGLARRLAVPPCRGRELLQYHRETFRHFWSWSDLVQDIAMLTGRMQTVFGWPIHVGPDTRPTSLRNFPMQANGAEMMRLATCLATERGIAVCCPVHDALLVEGPADGIEAVVTETQCAMREASELVLPGFPLRTDAKIVRYPDRYMDPRGKAMWATVCRLAEVVDPFPGGKGFPGGHPFPGGNPTPSLEGTPGPSL
jgi:hypothetical protein